MDRNVLWMIIGVGVLVLLPLSVTAATVSISPDKISPGEQVTIAFTGLPDAATLTILISGKFQTNEDGSFMFDNSNFNIPFALKNATITARLQNTKTNSLTVKSGDTEVRFSGNSVNNQYTKSFSSNVSPGVYDFFRLSGTAGSPGSTILTDLTLTGTKFGPDGGEITFNVGGAESGEVEITVVINHVEELKKTIFIEKAATTAIPGANVNVTTTTTNVSTTVVPLTTQGNVTLTGVTSETMPANTTVAGNQTPLSPPTTKTGPGILLVPFGIIGALLLMRRK
jgi:hypothetical protein